MWRAARRKPRNPRVGSRRRVLPGSRGRDTRSEVAACDDRHLACGRSFAARTRRSRSGDRRSRRPSEIPARRAAWSGREPTACLPRPSTIRRRPQNPSPRQREPIGRRDEINSDQRRHRTNSPPRSTTIARLPNPTTRSDEVTEIALGKRHERPLSDERPQPHCFAPVDCVHDTRRQQHRGCADEERRQASAYTHCSIFAEADGGSFVASGTSRAVATASRSALSLCTTQRCRAGRSEFHKPLGERSTTSTAASKSHQDLSGLFLIRAVELYLKPEGRFAFVLPFAALSRRQFAGFRRGRYDTPTGEVVVAFDTPWDLHKVKPNLFRVPPSVVSGTKPLDGRTGSRGQPSDRSSDAGHQALAASLMQYAYGVCC
jgi:hypothetical protein